MSFTRRHVRCYCCVRVRLLAKENRTEGLKRGLRNRSLEGPFQPVLQSRSHHSDRQQAVNHQELCTQLLCSNNSWRELLQDHQYDLKKIQFMSLKMLEFNENPILCSLCCKLEVKYHKFWAFKCSQHPFLNKLLAFRILLPQFLLPQCWEKGVCVNLPGIRGRTRITLYLQKVAEYKCFLCAAVITNLIILPWCKPQGLLSWKGWSKLSFCGGRCHCFLVTTLHGETKRST